MGEPIREGAGGASPELLDRYCSSTTLDCQAILTKSPDEQLERLAPLLPRLIMGLRRNRGEVPPEFRPAGRLGPRHVSALVAIGGAGPLTVGELAGRLGLTLAHASLVAGDLARAHLVERRPDERDRRRTVVSVSTEHEVAIRQMRARAGAPLVTFLETLEPEEAEAFVTHLVGLIEHLEAAAGDAPVPKV